MRRTISALSRARVVLGRPGKTLKVANQIPRPRQPPPHPRMVRPLTEVEEKSLRASCAIVRDVLLECAEWVKPGVTTDEINRRVHEKITSRSAYPSPLNYRGFPQSCCTSVNEIVCHGIPDDRELEDGDILNVDVSCYFQGFHGDASRMFLVGDVDDEGRRLVDVTERATQAAINACGPGVDITVVGDVISSMAEEEGFGIIRDYCGHAIGEDFHMLPYIFHHRNNSSFTLRPGHVFTIEPMLVEDGSTGSVLYEDDWTVATESGARSAQFEQTVMVTEDGIDILTR